MKIDYSVKGESIVKLFKRIVGVVLACLLVFGMGSTAFALEEATMRIVGSSAKRSESVEVTVEMTNNPGIIAAMVEIAYDPSVLTLTSVQDGGLLGTGTMLPGGDLTAMPYRVLWSDALATTNYTQNGTLVTFKFTIKPDAAYGDSTFSLTCVDGSCFDSDLNAVSFRAQSGVVTVAHVHNYVDVVTPPTCTEKGYTTHTCSICNDTYTDSEVTASGHTPTQVKGYSASCIAEGLTDGSKCAVCDTVFVAQKPIPKTAHTYGAWTTVREATKTEQGKKERVCSVCGAKETMTIPILPSVTIHGFKPTVEVDYRTTVKFSAVVTGPVDGGEIHWFVDGKDAGKGETYTVKEAKKSFAVQAKYVKDGEVLDETETESVKVKSGFFDKLKAFFRALFKKLPILAQEYVGFKTVY